MVLIEREHAYQCGLRVDITRYLNWNQGSPLGGQPEHSKSNGAAMIIDNGRHIMESYYGNHKVTSHFRLSIINKKK